MTSVLDVFTKIKSESAAEKPTLCIKLLKHVSLHSASSEEKEDELNTELKYTLRRLIQGLGSSKERIRKCYFASLATILKNSNTGISLQNIHEIVLNRFSTSDSKREEGEILIGRILSYGATIRSGIFLNSTTELQQEILTDIINRSKERSYLPLLTYTFIVELINMVDESVFFEMIWPVLCDEIVISWEDHTFHTLYCLLIISKKYPSNSKIRKKMKIVMSQTDLLNKDTMKHIFWKLVDLKWSISLQHPIYEAVCGAIVEHPNVDKLLIHFWSDPLAQLLSNSNTKLQQLAVIHIFNLFVSNTEMSVKYITMLYTNSFVRLITNPSLMEKSELWRKRVKEITEQVVKIFTLTQDVSEYAYDLFCKLSFDCGNLLIDKVLGAKLTHPLVAKLRKNEIKLLGNRCRDLIVVKKSKWNFKDKSYAVQLLAKLIGNRECNDLTWITEQLQFLAKYGFFQSGDYNAVSNELSGVIRNSLLSGLSHVGHVTRRLEPLRKLLGDLVTYVDELLRKEGLQLRTQLPKQGFEFWTNTIEFLGKVKSDSNLKKEVVATPVVIVFDILFSQMILYLLIDYDVAEDSIKELQNCYTRHVKKFGKKKKRKMEEENEEGEPDWIEVVVELFLSLLSRDRYFLRQLVSKVFPMLCNQLTMQAMYQILQILDPTNSDNILTNEDDEEEEEEEEGVEDKEYKSNGDVVEDDSDSSIDESDDDDMPISKLDAVRQALRDAMYTSETMTDTESVDLDDMDENEGKKLDKALSEAFKAYGGGGRMEGKNKTSNEKMLMNFRLRVLDLIDIYLDKEPSVVLLLDIMPVLFSLLNFCVKDTNERPLELRIRNTLKKMGNLKKYIKEEEITLSDLGKTLQSLIEKGDRSNPVFLDMLQQISDCTIFLIRIAARQSNNSISQTSPSIMGDIIIKSLQKFFLKRDCLLPYSLFENIITKTVWKENIFLVDECVTYAFNGSVRIFRRTQGLMLLHKFYKNSRLISTFKNDDNLHGYCKFEKKIIKNTIKLFTEESVEEVKESFLDNLLLLLTAMKLGASITQINWIKIAQVLPLITSSINQCTRNNFKKLANLLNVKINYELIVSKKGKMANGMNGKIVNGVNGNEEVEEEEEEEEGRNKRKKKHKISKEKINAKKIRMQLNNEDVFKFSKINNSDETMIE